MIEITSHDNSYQYFLFNRSRSYKLLFCCCSQESSILLHQESLPVEPVVAASVLLKKYEYESVSSEWRQRCVKFWNFQSLLVGWMCLLCQLLRAVPLTLRATCSREKEVGSWLTVSSCVVRRKPRVTRLVTVHPSLPVHRVLQYGSSWLVLQ